MADGVLGVDALPYLSVWVMKSGTSVVEVGEGGGTPFLEVVGLTMEGVLDMPGDRMSDRPRTAL